MASAIIHICVAKKLNEKLKRNEHAFFLGSIAPDISKLIGESKEKSHFLTTMKQNVPNILEFMKKYKDDLNHDFELGYFIHLYTDKLWFDGFIDRYVLGDSIRLLDGTKIVMSEKEAYYLIYNDYTNLNVQLLDEYQLDLSLFYLPVSYPDTKIEEIPIDKLQILVDKMGVIIKNSTQNVSYVFDITTVKQFIEEASDIIYQKLIEFHII